MDIDGMYYSYDNNFDFPYDRLPSPLEGGVLSTKNMMENFFFDDANDKAMIMNPHSLNIQSEEIAEMKYQFPGDQLQMLNIQSQNEASFYGREISMASMLQTTPENSSDDEKISAMWNSLESFNDVIPTPDYSSSADMHGNQVDPFYHDPFLSSNFDSSSFEVPSGRARSNSSLSLFDSFSAENTLMEMATQKRGRSASNPDPDKKKKVFYCHLCPTTFSRNHDLKRHIRIHLGIRPHKCQTCPKSFTRADALHRHVNVRGCRGV